MPNDMTPEKAMSIVEKLQGPDGLDALEQELGKAIENRRNQLHVIQGEITGLRTVLRLLTTLKKRWGLGEDVVEPATESADVDSKKPEKVSPEVKERLLKGLCTYKAFRKGWCQRKLRTKAEKNSGYCKIHMRELGLLNDAKNSDN